MATISWKEKQRLNKGMVTKHWGQTRCGPALPHGRGCWCQAAWPFVGSRLHRLQDITSLFTPRQNKTTTCFCPVPFPSQQPAHTGTTGHRISNMWMWKGKLTLPTGSPQEKIKKELWEPVHGAKFISFLEMWPVSRSDKAAGACSSFLRDVWPDPSCRAHGKRALHTGWIWRCSAEGLPEEVTKCWPPGSCHCDCWALP